MAERKQQNMGSDEEWEKWGRFEPYYGVITESRNFRANFDSAAREQFFATGKVHIDHVLATCRRLDAGFSPQRALDFGCGVGRIVVPLAALAGRVVGADVSGSMLAEARQNSVGLPNVALVRTDDTLAALDATGEAFDFIHSYIVFQHIPAVRGRKIFAGLVDRLAEGGIAAIHVKYADRRAAGNFGTRPPQAWRAMARPRPFSYRERCRDLEMQMNACSLNELFFILQTKGIRDVHVEFCDHDGQLGVFLYFRRTPAGQPAPEGYRP